MDLRQLEIFSKVAELGSFSRAAEALHLTQPTISEHIRTLEDEVGARLLDRLGRGASVTRVGQVLLTYAHRMLALQKEARQAVDSFQGKMTGELLVGGSTIPGEHVLPLLVGRFKEKYPDIAVTLLIGGSQMVVEWVVDGRVELGVVGAQIANRHVDYRELIPDEEVVVVSPGHPWNGRRHATLAEFLVEPLLIRERGSGTRAALEAALASAGIGLSSLRLAGEMGSNQAIKLAVKAGVGITVMSRRAVEEECRHGTLWSLRLKELKITRAFHLCMHRERTRSPLAEAFRTFLEAEAPSL